MIICRAPVRISFFGGGTDYPEHFVQEGGAVLATAIDKFCYITANRFLSDLFDYAIHALTSPGTATPRSDNRLSTPSAMRSL